jgi:hypothetical protein
MCRSDQFVGLHWISLQQGKLVCPAALVIFCEYLGEEMKYFAFHAWGCRYSGDETFTRHESLPLPTLSDLSICFRPAFFF